MVWAAAFAQNVPNGAFYAARAAHHAVACLRGIEKAQAWAVHNKENAPPEGPENRYSPSREAYVQSIDVLDPNTYGLMREFKNHKQEQS